MRHFLFSFIVLICVDVESGFVFLYTFKYFLVILTLHFFFTLLAASFMYNNCKALRAGIYSYEHLRHPVVLGPRTRTGSGGGSLGGSPVVTGKSLAGLNKQDNRSNKNDGGSVAYKKSTELPVLGTLSTNTEGAIIGLAVGLTS